MGISDGCGFVSSCGGPCSVEGGQDCVLRRVNGRRQSRWVVAVFGNGGGGGGSTRVRYDRSRMNETNDQLVYSRPCFSSHADEEYRKRLTALYGKYLKDGNRVLDLCSSSHSYLPVRRERWLPFVEGHGMNVEELEANPRLDSYFVQDLNQCVRLMSVASQYFDAVLNNCGFGYITHPDLLYKEVARVLVPNGIAIVSFSDRIFWEKAVAGWRNASAVERCDIVSDFLVGTSYFSIVERILKPTPRGRVVTHRALQAMSESSKRDPFFAVVARRV